MRYDGSTRETLPHTIIILFQYEPEGSTESLWEECRSAHEGSEVLLPAAAASPGVNEKEGILHADIKPDNILVSH